MRFLPVAVLNRPLTHGEIHPLLYLANFLFRQRVRHDHSQQVIARLEIANARSILRPPAAGNNKAPKNYAGSHGRSKETLEIRILRPKMSQNNN